MEQPRMNADSGGNPNSETRSPKAISYVIKKPSLARGSRGRSATGVGIGQRGITTVTTFLLHCYYTASTTLLHRYYDEALIDHGGGVARVRKGAKRYNRREHRGHRDGVARVRKGKRRDDFTQAADIMCVAWHSFRELPQYYRVVFRHAQGTPSIVLPGCFRGIFEVSGWYPWAGGHISSVAYCNRLRVEL